MAQQNRIQELFKEIKKEIESKSKKAGLNKHPGEVGESREEILRKFLTSLLPDFFRYGKGKLIDSLGVESPQQDIIIYSPYISVLKEDSKLFPVDAVCATIEVKSSLNKNELKESLKAIKSIKKLKKIRSSDEEIQCNIFAYNSISEKSILKALIEIKKELKLNKQELFDNLCVQGKFLISKNNSLKSISKAKKDFDYIFIDLGERSLPYFLDSMLNTMSIPYKPIPIFAKYLGIFKLKYDEWKLN